MDGAKEGSVDGESARPEGGRDGGGMAGVGAGGACCPEGAGEVGALTGGGSDGAQTAYEAALEERDARIGELEAAVAEASRTAEAAEALRAEIEELRRAGDEQREEFELQMAGVRSVKAARALLPDHDGDVSALKEAEPWLFAGAPAVAGKTGLPSAGAASDEGAQVRRWRRIAGLDEE